MSRPSLRKVRRKARHRRIRGKVRGTPVRPRLCVFRSSKHVYAQLIDDSAGKTLVSASSSDEDFDSSEGASGSNAAGARTVGENLAERARGRGIESAVFDRAGYLYHGRVKALAEGARSKGLRF